MLAYQQQAATAPAVQVLVFTIPGCPACEEYKPVLNRARRALEQAGHCVAPVQIVDCYAPQHKQLADHYKIQYTPTTIVLLYGQVWRRWDQPLSEGNVTYMLQRVSRGLHCEI